MLAVRNLLVVLAGSQSTQPAWATAQAWSAATGAAVHVFMPLPAGDAERSPPATPDASGEAWLDSWLDEARPASRTVTVTQRWSEAVLHEARRQEADLLVVSAEGAPPRELRSLLRELPCPVYLARHGRAPQRLAAAVGMTDDAVHSLLNTVVLEHLDALATLWKAGKVVLSALPSPADLIPLMGDTYAVSYVGNEFELTQRQRLLEQALPFGIDNASLYTLSGRPDTVLPQLVREADIDCLLVGTVGRQSMAAFWLGNTAEDVLGHLECDVMVLRPQDYYDPS